MLGRKTIALLATAAVAASALALGGVGASGTVKRKVVTKVVTVHDDYFQPTKVSVVRNGQVRWKWTPVFNTHNVKLTKAPAGVNKANFRSQTSSSPTYTFTRKLTKLGKYHFICSIHPVVMQMDVTVHK